MLAGAARLASMRRAAASMQRGVHRREEKGERDRDRAVSPQGASPAFAARRLRQTTCSAGQSPGRVIASFNGLGRDGIALSETSRNVSFCGHAILEHGVMCIPDALADPRCAQNPFVLGSPHIRFYAGCPPRVPGGFAVGTLCAIDPQPRAADTAQLMALRDFAD